MLHKTFGIIQSIEKIDGDFWANIYVDNCQTDELLTIEEALKYNIGDKILLIAGWDDWGITDTTEGYHVEIDREK